MRYIVGFVGAVLIFFAAFILCSLLLAAIAPGLLYPINLLGLHTNNPIGFILAALAAIVSFRASLKRKKKKTEAADDSKQI